MLFGYKQGVKHSTERGWQELTGAGSIEAQGKEKTLAGGGSRWGQGKKRAEGGHSVMLTPLSYPAPEPSSTEEQTDSQYLLFSVSFSRLTDCFFSEEVKDHSAAVTGVSYRPEKKQGDQLGDHNSSQRDDGAVYFT